MIKKGIGIFYIILGLCFLNLWITSEPAFGKTEELNFIPKDSDAVININYNPQDSGFSFVTGLWKERFEIREAPKKYEAIDQLYSELPFGKIAGAVFFPEEAYGLKSQPLHPDFMVVVEIKAKGKVFKDALDVLIKKKKPLKTLIYSGYKIVYRDKILEPYHGEKDLAAYVQVGDFFVISMEPKQLKKAIDTYKGKFDSIYKNAEFLKLKKELSDEDAFIFIDNHNREFSDNLKRWEEKEGMRLLLSSGFISSIGLAFDLETKDALKGKIVFVPAPGEEVFNIEDDAYFFAEIITRSLTKQNIDWISDVKSENGVIKLEFEGTGFEPIWEDMLLNKNIAFLEKEEEEEIIIEEIALEPDEQDSFNNTPKVIFVLILGVLALGILLFLKRKK